MTKLPKLQDTNPMPFGKHKGTAMANVPTSYLLWLHKEGCYHSQVKEYIDDNLDALKLEVNDD